MLQSLFVIVRQKMVESSQSLQCLETCPISHRKPLIRLKQLPKAPQCFPQVQHQSVTLPKLRLFRLTRLHLWLKHQILVPATNKLKAIWTTTQSRRHINTSPILQTCRPSHR